MKLLFTNVQLTIWNSIHMHDTGIQVKKWR